jgi:hypothetical protein
MAKVRFDGYGFGEKILEDIYFIAEVSDKQIVISVQISPESDNDYWQGLNRRYWLNEARDYLQTLIDQYGDLKDLIDNNEVSMV